MISRLLFAALLLAPLAAQADGPGVALSDEARLHFFLETELRYDSLAGQGGIGSPTNPTVDPSDFILHLRPGIKVQQAGTQVAFTGLANIDYVDYTGWLGPTHDLSYLGAAVQAALDVSKNGPIGFGVTESFSRSDHTTNPTLGIGSITDANDIGARLAFRPGGGAIEAGIAYDFGIEAYELNAPGNTGCTLAACNGTDFGNFDSQTHHFNLDARWRFFPKTAVTFNGGIEIRHYGDAAANIPADPFFAEVGLAGLVTEKIRVVIKAGVSDTLASAGANFLGPIGQLEFGWDPAETASVTAGILRQVQPVSGEYGWYDDWRGYAGGRLAIGGRVQLTATGSLDLIFFGDSGRHDTQGSVDAAVSVEVFRMLHASLGTTLTTRNSSLGGVFTYNRAEVYLRLNFTY